MQSLTRSIPRLLLFDSIPSSAAPRALRILNRPSSRSSACLQCRIPSQRRLFADESKPVNSSNSLDSLKDSNATQSSPQAETPTKSPHLEDVSSDTLPSTADSRRSALNHRFSHVMDHLQSNIFIASQRINDLTGYSGIESLKQQIHSLENKVQATQEAVRSSRAHYKSVVASRAATQREVTTLLARKDSWTPLDLERFTSLYRNDHGNEQAVQEAATRLADAEREAEIVAGKLSAAILGRYHEEQIWSDKIRRMSTWGTWGLMGVNVLLFLVFQFGFEPWRRRRLVGGFEEKVIEALEKERERLRVEGVVANSAGVQSVNAADIPEVGEQKDTAEKSSAVEAVISLAQNETSPKGKEVLEQITTPSIDIRDPATWRANLDDLFSPRLIQLRKQDVTTIALEGAATGAAIAAIIATLIFRPS